MAKVKYSFVDPNTKKDTAEMLFKLFVEVNRSKVEQTVTVALDTARKEEKTENCSVLPRVHR